MKSTLGYITLTAVLTAFAAGPAAASVEEECKLEAEDNGVEMELVKDYIADCVTSRGGEQQDEAGGGDMKPSGDEEAATDGDGKD